VSLPSDNPVLDVRGLVFPADGSVLNQVGLAVGEGETVAVLGARGAGKSALKSCLSGEAGAAAGTVWTNGKPFHLLSPEQRRAFRLRYYGLVHQDAAFLPELTLARTTALPLRFSGTGEREAGRRALTWLSRFEIADAADLRPVGLPVEILRRAALARAMVNDPIVLFADEPFVGLSDESADTTTRILRSIARSHGTAVILFTGDPETAARCERTVHLVAGRTAAEPVPPAAVAPVRPTGPQPDQTQQTEAQPSRVQVGR
jgi:putative ABC transport system ATP-binding protein